MRHLLDVRSGTLILAASALVAAPAHAVAQDPEPPEVPPAEAERPEPDAAQGEAASRVAGRVLDASTGRPVEGAFLSLSEPPRRAVSDSSGAFLLRDVPPGVYSLRVSHVAYGQRSVPAEVLEGRTTHLELRLDPRAIELDPLEVAVQREFRPRYLEEQGFYERRERGWGQYFEPEWVETRDVGFTRLSQFVEHLESVSPSGSPFCENRPVYVDGRRLMAEPEGSAGGLENNLLAELSSHEIGAAELYPTVAGVPTFALGDTSFTCGAVILWTRRWRDAERLAVGREVRLCEPRGTEGAVTVEGLVMDELTGVPLPGATVLADLLPEDGAAPEGDAARHGGRGSDRRETTADDQGRYRLCDLPVGHAVTLRAEVAERLGPVARLEALGAGQAQITPAAAEDGDLTPVADGDGTPVADVTRAAAGDRRVRRTEQDLAVRISEPGRVVGRILDRATGRPVASAEVALPQVPRRTLTDRQGYFVLEEAPPGDQALEIRHLGYETLRDTLIVAANRTAEVQAQLSADPVALEPLVVTAIRSRRLERRGFYERRQWGERAGTGHFWGPEEIERRAPAFVSHLVGDAPGMRLECGGGRGCTVLSGRSPGCSAATVYVDGVLMTGGIADEASILDDFVRPLDVAGVEAYPGGASVPAEFAGPRARCGVVAIWTR